MSLNTEFMIRTWFKALEGIPVTLGITASSMLIALPFGFLIALIRIYHVRILEPLMSVLVSFIRGTPILLQILITYSLFPSLMNAAVKAWNWNFDVFGINPIIYAVIVFAINTTALLSEAFRSALLAVNQGQMEAALSIGMTKVQAYRRIMVPQAMVIMLPNLCTIVVNLVKSTSLAFLMTVKDIMAIAKIEASYGYNYIEAYIVVFIIYVLLCMVIQLGMHWIEKQAGSYRKGNPEKERRRSHAGS